MITIELKTLVSGTIVTVLNGIDDEKYDLKRIKNVLRKLTKCNKTKLTDNNEIILEGSHRKICNDFVTSIGFN